MRQALPAIVLLMVVATLLSCGAAPALAQIPAAQMWPPTGAARDFALIKRAGVYHIFHIQNIEGTDQNWLGHQTSTDLYHWTPQPNVIVGTQKTSPTVKDGRNGWNRDFVWAPSILERDGVYYMFYTGVRQRPWNPSCPGQSYQKTGVAISTDLFTWRLALDPWFTPERTSWALQGDTCTYNYGNFRDPFVMQDPATGEWLMYYVTIPNAAAVAARSRSS
jgi:sucrose-6-phosphate hydrolase SacC (GH32 family)